MIPLLLAAAVNVGCGDGLWAHVYRPERLEVVDPCVTVTGVIVDATAAQKTRRKDGLRHEPDGDSHGWLRLDPTFRKFLTVGNTKHEHGKLVFEVVCQFRVDPDNGPASKACQGYTNRVVVPPPGTHVRMRGALVLDKHHGGWAEIHPVASVEVIK